MDTYRLISGERQGNVACFKLRKTRLEEQEITEIGDEVRAAANTLGCSSVALSLGPGTPECLYSVFLAKLVGLRNDLRKQGGDLALVDVGPVTYSVFRACALHKEFVFLPDFPAAVAHFESVS